MEQPIMPSPPVPCYIVDLSPSIFLSTLFSNTYTAIKNNSINYEYRHTSFYVTNSMSLS
jgi:hypothetical protein